MHLKSNENYFKTYKKFLVFFKLNVQKHTNHQFNISLSIKAVLDFQPHAPKAFRSLTFSSCSNIRKILRKRRKVDECLN